VFFDWGGKRLEKKCSFVYPKKFEKMGKKHSRIIFGVQG